MTTKRQEYRSRVIHGTLAICAAIAWIIGCEQVLGAQTPKLSIVSPTMNTVVAPGDIVTVSVVRAKGSGITDVAVNAFGWSQIVNGSDPLMLTFQVSPTAAAGPFQVLAFDVTRKSTSGIGAVSSPLVLIIESPITFTSLVANYAALTLQFVGDVAFLTVTGLAPSSSPVPLTDSSRTSFVSQNPNVATVNQSGFVSATGLGNTTIIVTYTNPDSSVVTAYVPVFVPFLIKGDLNGDGRVDKEDLQILLQSLNQPDSVPGDARDLNGDGVINALDARILVTLCTKPGCATH